MNRIEAGQPRDAAPIDANFQELKSDVFNITDANITSAAGIQGTKIAANTLPGDRVVTGTITAAQMAAGSVGTEELIDLAVTKPKLSTTVGSRVAKAQTEIKTYSGTVGFTTGGSRIGIAMTARVGQQVVGGTNSWIVIISQADNENAVTQVTTQTSVPGVAIPVASTTVIGLVLTSVTFALGGGAATFDMQYIENT